MIPDVRTVLTIADARDREQIYRIRHHVYATELAQHPENPAGELVDRLDAINVYLVAKRSETVLGFAAVTPPGDLGYSLEKYFRRAEVPLTFDDALYEIRLLTVIHPARRSDLASLLMYGAFRYCESRGARQIAAIGRVEVLDVYCRAGLQPLGRRVQAGAVTYELMTGDVRDLRRNLDQFAGVVRRLEREVVWRVAGVPFRPDHGCYHGGASFEAVGDEFDGLAHANRIISADVLDAWFDPAPTVVEKVGKHLTFSLKTSPPTGCEGMQRVIARARGVGIDNILPAAGSSDLIFAALKAWVTRDSRVLLLDPMYGEYAHVLEKVIGVSFDRLRLARATCYDIEPDELRACLARRYDWVVLVNPNNPTGRYMPAPSLIEVLSSAPPTTRVWVDETYVDYAGDESLEQFAAASPNVVVCKSMSKVYALSGVRAAYLCGPASLIQDLRVSCPPWSVSLPAQMAACEALRAPDYYRRQWQQTGVLRRDLAESLADLGWDVIPGCANFLLCHLPSDGPNAATVAANARAHGLFLREVANLGSAVGEHALRVAVKDRGTNDRMHTILTRTLADLGAVRSPHASTSEFAKLS